MALNIKDPETDAVVRRLAELTGKAITTVVREAVEEKLEREERLRNKASIEELMAIVDGYHRLPVIDDRAPDEIIGYDESGAPA